MPQTKTLTIRGGPMDGEPVNATDLKPGWVWVPYRRAWYYLHDVDYRAVANTRRPDGEYKAWAWYDGQTLVWHPQEAKA